MKNKDAKTIIDFLEYVGKNMAVKDENFEYHRDTIYECKCILDEEVNGAETSQDEALNLAGVSGSSIELIDRLLQNDLEEAGKLTRLELDEQTEHELGLSIGRTKLALKEIKNYR